jgi:FAD/FMN-containing dehydrogenase
VMYGGIDLHPEVIVRVANAEDVQRVVGFARESGLPLAVRGGGHSIAGHSLVEDGIVLDLSRSPSRGSTSTPRHGPRGPRRA